MPINYSCIFRGSLITLLFSLVTIAANLAQAPVISSFYPPAGPVGTVVSITGSSLQNVNELTIGGVQSIIVAKSETNMKAMVMPGAQNTAIVAMADNGSFETPTTFNVTPTLYPSVQKGGKIVGSGSSYFTVHGSCLALSADGNFAAIYGKGHMDNMGALWFYRLTDFGWLQMGEHLVLEDAAGNWAGWLEGFSLGLSADGRTLVFGRSKDSIGAGGLWFFEQDSNGQWVQQGSKILGTGAIGQALQGYSVAISADGNTVISGAPADNGDTGAIWIFKRVNGQWEQDGEKLVGTGAIGNARQGVAVALSADGNTAAFGGPNDNTIGATWVFTQIDGAWVQQGEKLVGTWGEETSYWPWQGRVLALSADGSTLAVGGMYNAGAWIFHRENGDWSQQSDRLHSQIQNFGMSVALTADGNIAVIGAPSQPVGSAWVFSRNDGEWAPQGDGLIGTGVQYVAQQGTAIALSATGSTLFTAGRYDNNWTGAVWVFVAEPSVGVVELPDDELSASLVNGRLTVFGPSHILGSAQRLTVTDLNGRYVLDEQTRHNNSRILEFALPNVSSGIYIVTLHTDREAHSTKVSLVK